jgi:tetratricopeptide (TPR) repeat protein
MGLPHHSSRIRQAIEGLDLFERARGLTRSLRHLPLWLKVAASLLGAVSASLAILQFFGIAPLALPQTPSEIAEAHCADKLKLKGADATRCIASMTASLNAVLTEGNADLRLAFEALDAGKTDEARTILERVARTEENGSETNRADAADAYALLGGLDYLANPQAALNAYASAVRLNARDLLSRLSLGGLQRNLGLLDEAMASYQTTITLARELGDKAAQASASLGLAEIEIMQRRLPLAAQHADTASRLFSALGDKQGLAWTLGLRAQIALESQAHDAALDLLEQEAALGRELKNAEIELDALSLRGNVHRNAGRLDQAEADVHKALAESRRLGNRGIEATMLATLGQIAGERGRLEEARGHYEAALGIFHAQQDREGEAHVKGELGELLFNMNSTELPRALALMGEAAATYEEIGLPASAASYHLSAADLLALHPELGSQAQALIAALETARAGGDAYLGAEAGVRLGRLNLQGHNLGLADAYFRDAYQAAQSVGDEVNMAAALFGIGALTAANGNKELGCRQIADALAMTANFDAAIAADLATRAAAVGCALQLPPAPPPEPQSNQPPMP